MNISKQIWRPDTCKCVIEEQYDRDDPTSPMTQSAVISKCEVHTEVPDENLHNVVYLGENKIKNMMYANFVQNADSSLIDEKVNDDGSITRDLKKGVKFDWTFEGTGENRSLKINIGGKVQTESAVVDVVVSDTTLTSLSNFAIENFDVGKINII